ncbi:MAG: hypothetical protein CM1200mP40_36220 [Gammaproteobacteria bacterium]|nr:MAG: hypothetical protein CM1200mP40_36220 [Gammaproteobacteria bacterium]
MTDDIPALAENDEDVIDEEEDDPLILESGRILADFIALNHRRISAIATSLFPLIIAFYFTSRKRGPQRGPTSGVEFKRGIQSI